MIAYLSRPAAIVLAAIVAAVCLWCTTVPTPPLVVAQTHDYTDVQLYRGIVDAVAAGRPYYQAATELQRAHAYPLRPFVTVRPPIFAWWAALVGWHGVRLSGIVLVLVGLVSWALALQGRLWRVERVGVALLVALASAPLVGPAALPFHECLAGLCMAVALAGVCGWPRRWWWIMVPLAIGLAVRELVLPFVVLVLAFALVERRWREAAAWGALIAVWLGFMAWHAHQVALMWHPGDGVSQGWTAMQGLAGGLRAIVQTSVLSMLPPSLALMGAALPVLGWLALDGRAGRFCLLLVAGYVALLSVFSRPDTFYWGALMPPWYFVGYALVPRAVVQWAQVMGKSPMGANICSKSPGSTPVEGHELAKQE